MNKKLYASMTAGAMLFSLGATTASASTTQGVTVKHNAYLISAPHLHSQRLVLERAGTTLKVESGSSAYWWHVKDQNGRDGYITKNRYYTAQTQVASSTSANTSAAPTPVSKTTSGTMTHLPPGVSYDAGVHPLAPLNATNQQKFNAILQVAQSKLGTPYFWGHNEDRGQYGFDCSNFTAYVYHHALGYKMSGASQTQYHSVGWAVPKSNMQPGDLLVFNQGGHVGIYIGNGQMIQCGGGLRKVGYLKVSPGSYWYNHLTVAKRMY